MLETGLCWEAKGEKKQHWERLSVREKGRQRESTPCKFRRWKRRRAEHLSGPDRARLATTEAYGDPPRAQTDRRTPRPRLTQGDLSPL